MNKSPKNQNDNEDYKAWVDVNDLNAHFDTWIKLLKEYETVKSFYDDPIADSFKDEFYAEFEIVDEDADVNPFKINQILFLDAYLQNIDKVLDDFTEEQNTSDIQDIKRDIGVLRENLTTKPKKWVIEKLSKVCAKISKQGTKFIREFFSDAKKELMKQGIKGLINIAVEKGTDLLT
jgi:hypothetical protein